MLKTDVKGGVASRIGANRFFCSRGFFSVILGHFQCLTASKEGSGMLITCGPDPPLQDVQVWSSALEVLIT